MSAVKASKKEGCNRTMSDMEKMDETLAAEAVETAAPAPKSDKKEKAPAKKEKDKKPSFFARVSRWFREMKSELKKVSWPTGKDTIKNVGTVIACVIVVGICIWLFDWLTHAVIDALLNLFA